MSSASPVSSVDCSFLIGVLGEAVLLHRGREDVGAERVVLLLGQVDRAERLAVGAPLRRGHVLLPDPRHLGLFASYADRVPRAAGPGARFGSGTEGGKRRARRPALPLSERPNLAAIGSPCRDRWQRRRVVRSFAWKRAPQRGWAPLDEAELEPFTVGIEEEVMLLDPGDWSARPAVRRAARAASTPELDERPQPRDPRGDDRVRDRAPMPPRRRGGAGARRAAGAARRRARASSGRAAAAAGTHPFATWEETELSPDAPLPLRPRDDARARPPRADLRHARPRRRRRSRARHRDRQPDARPPAAPARAVGQLALLAGARQRARLGADADLLAPSRAPGSRARSTATTTTWRRSRR